MPLVTRQALSDERVQLNAAGKVELKLKTPWRDGITHLVMSPLEFKQRLAGLYRDRSWTRPGYQVAAGCERLLVADSASSARFQEAALRDPSFRRWRRRAV